MPSCQDLHPSQASKPSRAPLERTTRQSSKAVHHRLQNRVELLCPSVFPYFDPTDPRYTDGELRSAVSSTSMLVLCANRLFASVE